MAQPKVILLTGYGINCEEETAAAFTACGAVAEIVHVNDLIAAPGRLAQAQMFVVPGGFSYGDDTGSGNALANKIRHSLWEELMSFVAADKLVLGICNGFQVLVNLGLLPGTSNDCRGERQVALIANRSARYECRWVHLVVDAEKSVFLRGLDYLYLPVAHGEGRFYTDAALLAELRAAGQLALRYVAADRQPAAGRFPENPNGSLEDVAGICSPNGRVFGLMPHPERAFRLAQRPDWPELLAREPAAADWRAPGPGRALFANAVNYFS